MLFFDNDIKDNNTSTKKKQTLSEFYNFSGYQSKSKRH